MRWWSAAVAVGALAASANAFAQSPKPRRGVYASGALGFGAGYTREHVFDAPPTGGGFALEIHGALGYAPLDGLALAVDGRVLLHSDLLAPVVGGLVDWYPDPYGPWHVELGLGRFVDMTASTRTFSSGGAQGAADFTDSSPTGGIFGHAGAGYAFRAGRVAFSPTLDVYRARWAGDGEELDAYGALLELTVVRL